MKDIKYFKIEDKESTATFHFEIDMNSLDNDEPTISWQNHSGITVPSMRQIYSGASKKTRRRIDAIEGELMSIPLIQWVNKLEDGGSHEFYEFTLTCIN